MIILFAWSERANRTKFDLIWAHKYSGSYVDKNLKVLVLLSIDLYNAILLFLKLDLDLELDVVKQLSLLLVFELEIGLGLIK